MSEYEIRNGRLEVKGFANMTRDIGAEIHRLIESILARRADISGQELRDAAKKLRDLTRRSDDEAEGRMRLCTFKRYGMDAKVAVNPDTVCKVQEQTIDGQPEQKATAIFFSDKEFILVDDSVAAVTAKLADETEGGNQ